ncbi:hypothetical protein [Vibrio splendidus]|uniref:hypothetical protein n=1 Tax=Vibrio splendidus TaxID=29497 RepID=UPI0002E4A058|nr:hypothetical protein [Vibrio splendidus]MDP2590837.1 hypothetical protein [Vibrio splendidus]OEE54202.1 hypothetical protein A146_13985 [Vibrio splendidus FF-500]
MTKEFLETKVREVFADFSGEEWCDLNHSDLNVDSYLSIANQQKYILKYYGAYFCELYGMYEKFISGYNSDTLNVLSFGCGSGVDCEALNRVIVDLGVNIEVNYVGIDMVDWNYRPNFRWATFKKMCVSKLTKTDVVDVNLFIFPKSLTEFTRETREKIGELISQECSEDCINFINTYVTDYASDHNRVDGVDQFGTINKILKNENWSCSTDPAEYYYKNNSGWLGYNFDFFKLPDEVKPFVEELKDRCQNHDGSSDCINCTIDFIPILNSRYLAFNLLEYKRN